MSKPAVSPVAPPPTSCFPLLFTATSIRRARQRIRARTINTLHAYKKELDGSLETTSTTCAATTTTTVGTIIEGSSTATCAATNQVAASQESTSCRRLDVEFLSQTSATIAIAPSSPSTVAPPHDQSVGTTAANPAISSPGKRGTDTSLGLIPSESSEDPFSHAQASKQETQETEKPASLVVAPRSATGTHAPTLGAGLDLPNTAAAAPDPLPTATPPSSRAPLRSLSMGGKPRAPNSASRPPSRPPSMPLAGNDRFYHPALRRSGSRSLTAIPSLGLSGSRGGRGLESGGLDASLSSSSTPQHVPTLGALKAHFTSSTSSFSASFSGRRRASFTAGTMGGRHNPPPLTRRLSLQELLQPREDYSYRADPSAPTLPPRLLPMISNGMARLVVNMKEAYMTPATWKLCYSLFRAEDAAKIQRFRFEKDRRLSLGSQLLQRAVIAWTFGVSYPEIVISRTEKGKPFFKYTPTHPGEVPGEEETAQVPFPNWNYNVSHHGDFVGIASEPVCLVGLDIMNAKEKPRGGGRERGAHDFFKSFHRQLSATEWGSIYEAPSEETKLERFYRQWALKVGQRGEESGSGRAWVVLVLIRGPKDSSPPIPCSILPRGAAQEAYIKAIGSGLSFSPRRIEITGLDHEQRPYTEEAYDPSMLRIDGAERPDWKFKFSALDYGHVACVSRGPPSDAIEDYRKNLLEPWLPNSPLQYGLESVQPEFEVLSLRELIPVHRLEEFDRSVAVGNGEGIEEGLVLGLSERCASQP